MSDVAVSVEGGVACIVFGDTLVTLWREPPSVARWVWHVAQLERVAIAHGQAVVSLHLILPSSTPDSGTRARMQADLKRMGHKLRRLVVVPLGNSLWMNLVRPLVRTVLLLSGQSNRLAVVDSVSLALEQVRAAASATTPTASELRAGIAALCSALNVEQSAAA